MSVNLETEPTAPIEAGPEHQRLAKLAGSWRGSAKLYFEPGKLAGEAPWEGRIALLLGGRFARFEYRSSMEDKPTAGELLIGFEKSEKMWRTSWIDSGHTGTAILVSSGPQSTGAISVKGTWYPGGGNPPWGWRTDFDDARDGELALRMYNITPEGEESLGVDIVLRRA